jgi:glycosyltransferase involved in cell wall biosynthesis
MKFLLSTYSTAFAISGGGESELVQVAETLSEVSHIADIYGTQSRPIDFYDAYMHFSVHADGWALFQLLSQHNKSLLLWPNVWWSAFPGQEELNRVSQFVHLAHKLLFKTRAERENFLQFVNVPIEKTMVLRVCLSKRFLDHADFALAKTIVGFDDYVISLGRIEPVKNQLNLIRALKQLKLKGVLVGGSNNPNYLAQCKAEGQEQIAFLPFVKPCSNVLVSLLAGASVMAEPCFDPSGRSSLEGALLGKPLVLASHQTNHELIGQHFYAAHPDSVDSIASAIKLALKDNKNHAAAAAQWVRTKNASDEAIDRFALAVVDACDE